MEKPGKTRTVMSWLRACRLYDLSSPSSPSLLSCPSSSLQFLTGYYWALFDGHGGPEAAIIASNYLHYCIKQKLEEVVGGIIEARPPMHLSGRCVCDSDPQFVEEKHIHAEDLVVGALENAFQECVSTPCRAPVLLPQAVSLSLPAAQGGQGLQSCSSSSRQERSAKPLSVLGSRWVSSPGSASDLLHVSRADPEQSYSISAKLHPGDTFLES